MSERPLLLFPRPALVDRTKQKSYPMDRGVHKPSHSRQGLRLSPFFAQLQRAFHNRSVEIQQTTAGIDPEQVLVIETIGNIENFTNAVKKIDGLEWMGEVENNTITPDEDFFIRSNPEKKLTGRLYLVMSNQEALTQMVSLWTRYKSDPGMKFQTGLTKFRDVFLSLKDIRRWDVQDRLNETGIIEAWKEDLQYGDNDIVRFEAELWYRTNFEKRLESRQQVEKLIDSSGGKVISECVINEICYHSLRAEMPRNSIQEVIDHHETELVKCDSIMFFRPTGQIATDKRPVEGEFLEFDKQNLPTPSGHPIIALFDGFPLQNHHLLSGRLIVDDPDNWEDGYSAADRIHGTAMASLIIHGDLNENLNPLQRPVYVRPIMKPIRMYSSPRPEQIPDDILVVDLIHRAVRTLFENDGNELASNIKVINLSIGDPSRQFVQFLSPLSKLIDWLSFKYNLLFIISAGNHITSIDTGIPNTVFETLSNSEREEIIIKSLYEDARNRKLLSPAESINGITVGATHHDNSPANRFENRIDLFEDLLPSPVSTFGSGYNRSIKPDLV